MEVTVNIGTGAHQATPMPTAPPTATVIERAVAEEDALDAKAKAEAEADKAVAKPADAQSVGNQAGESAVDIDQE